MSLDKILSDLKEGVTDTSTENSVVLDTPPIVDQKQNIQSFRIDANSLNTSIVKKINALYDLGIIRSTIRDTPKVDYKVAQEVFTMLPDTSVADRAKVTAAPSIINKEILENVLKTQTGEYSFISYQLKTDIDKIIEDITSNSERMLEVQSYIASFIEQVKEDSDRLVSVAPIVISEGNSFNLFTLPIFSIATKVNDGYLHYDKYQDALTCKYNEILQDETFKKCLTNITTIYNVESISLFEFITLTKSVSESIKLKIEEFGIRVNQYNSLKGDVEKEVTQELVNMVNSTELIYKDLLYFKELHDITHTSNNVFDKVLALVKFLD